MCFPGRGVFVMCIGGFFLGRPGRRLELGGCVCTSTMVVVCDAVFGVDVGSQHDRCHVDASMISFSIMEVTL